jgi:hypothetical protein
MTLHEQIRELRVALAETAARTHEEAALLAKAQRRPDGLREMLLRSAELRVAAAEVRLEAAGG